MKFYIAAPTKLWAGVREKIAYLQARGHTCTHDWTVEVEKEMTRFSEVDHLECARKDIQGVKDAAVVLFWNAPACGSKGGMHTEFGIALELGKKICVFGLPVDGTSNIFFRLVDYRKNFDEAAELLGLNSDE